MSEKPQNLKPRTKALALRVIRMLLSGCFGLAVLTGCESFQDTTFAPIKAVLEPVTGGAQHFVVVNSSDQILHNYYFRVYMWDDHNLFYTWGDTPRRRPAMTYTFTSSGTKWEPGEEQRFRDWKMPSEMFILKPVSRVEIVGSCDEGQFRENWQINATGQLEPTEREKSR
jgi:hypothetical protein